MQELFGQSKASHLFLMCHVDESTFALLDHVVITDQLGAWQLLTDVPLILGDTVGNQTEANSDSSFSKEIHFWHFVFFIVDEIVFFSIIELPG